MRRRRTDRQTDREDGRKNYDLFLHQLSEFVCVGGGGVGAGQTGVGKEMNGEMENRQTDRQREEDRKRNDDLLLHQLSRCVCVCGGGRGAALDRRA